MFLNGPVWPLAQALTHPTATIQKGEARRQARQGAVEVAFGVGAPGQAMPSAKHGVGFVGGSERPKTHQTNWCVVFHEGAEAWARARGAGRVLEVRSPGTGTTPLNTPLVAVGNRPHNGRNPARYPDAEFNDLEVLGRAGQRLQIELQMVALGRMWFGPKRTFTIEPEP